MQNNENFLRVFELYKTREKITSDRKAAIAIGMDAKSINDYRKGRSSPDAYACVRLGLAAGYDPITLIAAVQSEKETKPQRQAFWRDFFQRVTQRGLLPALICGATCLIAPPDSRSETNNPYKTSHYTK